jgi:hypothetical protein
LRARQTRISSNASARFPRHLHYRPLAAHGSATVEDEERRLHSRFSGSGAQRKLGKAAAVKSDGSRK